MSNERDSQTLERIASALESIAKTVGVVDFCVDTVVASMLDPENPMQFPAEFREGIQKVVAGQGTNGDAFASAAAWQKLRDVDGAPLPLTDEMRARLARLKYRPGGGVRLPIDDDA